MACDVMPERPPKASAQALADAKRVLDKAAARIAREEHAEKGRTEKHC